MTGLEDERSRILHLRRVQRPRRIESDAESRSLRRQPKSSVILREIGVRAANLNAVEGPDVLFEWKRARQGILTNRPPSEMPRQAYAGANGQVALRLRG